MAYSILSQNSFVDKHGVKSFHMIRSAISDGDGNDVQASLVYLSILMKDSDGECCIDWIVAPASVGTLKKFRASKA